MTTEIDYKLRERITHAVSAGWTHHANERKQMDSDLADAIVEEVMKEGAKIYLGYATTMQLIEELQARADVSQTIGEAWPSYRTVDDA